MEVLWCREVSPSARPATVDGNLSPGAGGPTFATHGRSEPPVARFFQQPMSCISYFSCETIPRPTRLMWSWNPGMRPDL